MLSSIGTPPAQVATAGTEVTFRKVTDWGSGFTGEMTIKNSATPPLSGGTLAFDFPADVTNIWNAKILSRVDTRYVIQSMPYNVNLAPDASASLGFQVATTRSASRSLANARLDGKPV